MKYILCLLFILPSLAFAQIEPDVINETQEQSVKLGADAEKAIKKFDKNFIILKPRHFLAPVIGIFEGFPRELPQAVAADFNGDRVRDIVVMGLTEEKKTIVVKAILIQSSQKGYFVTPIDQWNARQKRGTSLKDAYNKLHDLEMYLGLSERIEVRNSNVPLDRRSFKIEVYNSKTTLLFTEGGAIKPVAFKNKK